MTGTYDHNVHQMLQLTEDVSRLIATWDLTMPPQGIHKFGPVGGLLPLNMMHCKECRRPLAYD